MSLELVTLELVLSSLGIALASLVLFIMTMRMYREWRAAVHVHVRESMTSVLSKILDTERAFSIQDRAVLIDGEQLYTIPKPGGPVGDAVREFLVDHLSFISGDLRGRLVTILESAGYVAASMRQLRSPLGETRLKACMMLGGMHSRIAIPALIEIFNDDPDAMVRITAAEALGVVGAEPAVAHLLKALRDPTRFQQVRVAEVLARMGMMAVPALTAAIDDDDARMSALALDILADIGWMSDFDPAIRALTHVSPEVRARAAEALGRAGALEATEAVMKAAADPAWFVRVRVMKALEALGAPHERSQRARYLGTLEQGLHDGVWWVRQHAAEALVKVGEDGRRLLARAMIEAPDSPARRASVSALQLHLIASAAKSRKTAIAR
ncbi:MAG TPA: HEAT repeat domain-containing protein [Candidatus Eremiobacteraceae bacterium]|nr:HEAT repeat domain-containing protein [Candidatus Eremiobacteraceae bacterium]